MIKIEFLRFMLDGLHEDLNRVTDKPKWSFKDSEIDKLPYVLHCLMDTKYLLEIYKKHSLLGIDINRVIHPLFLVKFNLNFDLNTLRSLWRTTSKHSNMFRMWIPIYYI